MRTALVRFVALLAVAGVASCAERVDRPQGTAGLDDFATGVAVGARVMDNVTACVVDAVCTLELQFADTSVVVVYGSGERPQDSCSTPREASDVAFGLGGGDMVSVELTACSEHRLVLARVSLQPRGGAWPPP